MKCKNCGGDMSGDGVTRAFICENLDRSNYTLEPDADPTYCEDFLTVTAMVSRALFTGAVEDRVFDECKDITEKEKEMIVKTEISRNLAKFIIDKMYLKDHTIHPSEKAYSAELFVFSNKQLLAFKRAVEQQFAAKIMNMVKEK